MQRELFTQERECSAQRYVDALLVLLCCTVQCYVYVYTEYIGQSIMKFCPDEEELVLEIFKQLGSGNTIRDVPIRFRAKSGAIRHLLIDRLVTISYCL
jgi:hypothetical protein